MIWWTLALFVVSFLLTALLAPKPEIENARPDALNPDNFPRATENAPIPLVLGKVRMNAPNTIWYGNFRSVPIKERIRVSLFKKVTVIVGHDYYIDIDLALAMGPGVAMTKIFVDDKEFWTGTTSITAPTAINKSDLSFFGGKKEGGGFTINGTYYCGSLDLAQQPVDSHLTSVFGAGVVPAYLGTAHIVIPNMYIGETPQLRKMAFLLECYTNSLGITNNGKIGEDMNPAEAIYQIMTDKWRGMGVDPSNIDLVRLKAMGETLYTEGNGCSIVVTAEQDGKKLITEILRQVDGIAHQDPETGKIVFDLIRDDYDIDDIPEFDENDIVEITSFSRTSWSGVYSQIKITHPQRDKESSAVAIAQDPGIFAMLGKLKTTTISMPFVYDKSNANRIASRERSQLSIPLFNMTIEFKRTANTLRPGKVFKISWPKYGFQNLVLRVGNFDLGSLLDGKIIVNCIQDRFSIADTVFADSDDSGWVDPLVPPVDITIFDVIELPKVICNTLEYPPTDGQVAVMPLAVKPQLRSNAFDMICGGTTGVLATRNPEYVEYLGTGVLSVQYPATAGIATGLDSTVGIDISGAGSSVFSSVATLANIRAMEAGLLYMDGEWLGFTASSNLGSGNWRITNVYRGLFGSTVKTHAVGTRIYEVGSDMFPQGQVDNIVETNTIFYKLLDRVGRRIRSEADVVQSSKNLSGLIANRPLRPRFLQLAGARTGINITTAVAQNLTWRASDRRLTSASIENDAAETPDQTEVYDVDVMINGVRNATLSGIGVTSPYSVPFNLTTITEPNCEFRVTARRSAGDARSSSGYAVLPFSMTQ